MIQVLGTSRTATGVVQGHSAAGLDSGALFPPKNHLRRFSLAKSATLRHVQDLLANHRQPLAQPGEISCSASSGSEGSGDEHGSLPFEQQ